MAKNLLALLLFIAFLFLSLDLRAEDSNQIIQNQKQLDDKLEVDREFLEDVEKKIKDEALLLRKEEDFLTKKECNIIK